MFLCVCVCCLFFSGSQSQKNSKTDVRFRIATVGGGKERGRAALLNYARHSPPPAQKFWDCKLLDHPAPNEVLVPGVPGEVNACLLVSQGSLQKLGV